MKTYMKTKATNFNKKQMFLGFITGIFYYCMIINITR